MRRAVAGHSPQLGAVVVSSVDLIAVSDRRLLALTSVFMYCTSHPQTSSDGESKPKLPDTPHRSLLPEHER